MLYRKIVGWFVVLSLFVLIAGCSDNEEYNPAGTNNNGDNPPTIALQSTIDVPAGLQNSNDPHAMQTLAYINSIQANFQVFSAWFTPQGTGKVAKISSPQDWERTWTYNGLTVIWRAYEEGDEYKWEVIYDGEQDGMTFDNFKFMEASQKKNGMEGSMFWYDMIDNGQSELVYQWNWTKEENNNGNLVKHFNVEFMNDSHFELTGNPDKSGEVFYYSYMNNDYVLQYESHWNPDGSGSWQTYDDNGDPLDNGTWTP